MSIDREIGASKKEQPRGVTFHYQPPTAGTHTVFVAGDFNQWSPQSIPLIPTDGIYEATVFLLPGKYAYKLIVDGVWQTDPKALLLEPDTFGGYQSVLMVGDPEHETVKLVEFTYRPDHEVSTIHVAGSFNLWNPHSLTMQPQGDGSYTLLVFLRKGSYEYKFIINQETWVVDEHAALIVTDDMGNQNSSILVDDTYPDFHREWKEWDALDNIPMEPDYITCQLVKEDTIEFRAKIWCGQIDRMTLWLEGDKFTMNYLGQDSSYDYYHLLLPLTSQQTTKKYFFIAERGRKNLYLYPEELSTRMKKDLFFIWQQPKEELFLTPKWAYSSVMYQIFPERFFNGDTTNDPDFTESYYDDCRTAPPKGKKLKPQQEYFHLVEDWYNIAGLKKNPYHPEGKPDWWSFYGGDIVGIEQKLPYLNDLGISLLYLNPVFQAKSNHHYDAADYMKLDPHFGTPEEFKHFVKASHKMGIRIILDVAFNHTGEAFWAFQDCVEKGPGSAYWNWYDWKKWPLPSPLPYDYQPRDYYQCWWGVKDLPDLNFDLARPHPIENEITDIRLAAPNWNVVNYILSVAEYWIKEMDLDGFRLDVPEEVPFWFWKIFRQKVKSLKSDSLLIGEIWHRATDWVNGDYFDSVMNYAFFKDPVLDFFLLRKLDARGFAQQIVQGLVAYPIQGTWCMMNLLGSHDTYRVIELAKGNIHKLKLAILFQMTFIGIPHIYYGDEILMYGKGDPDNRRPFNWRYQEDSRAIGMHDYYKRLIQIRSQFPVLQTGEFGVLYTEGKILAFERKDDNTICIIVLNNEAKRSTCMIPCSLNKDAVTDLLTGRIFPIQNGFIHMNLGDMEGTILI